MARLLMVAVILGMFTQVAIADVDSGPDVLGVYFDENGDQICKDDVWFATPFSVWIVYTNPSAASILGFEAGYHTTADFLQLGLYPPCGLVWVFPPELDNLTVVCSTPMATTEATPLLRVEYMSLGSESPDSIFYLEKARESSLPGDNPYIILADGSYLAAQAGVAAYTTLCCGVPTENMDWGMIKTLYR